MAKLVKKGNRNTNNYVLPVIYPYTYISHYYYQRLSKNKKLSFNYNVSQLLNNCLLEFFIKITTEKNLKLNNCQ